MPREYASDVIDQQRQNGTTLIEPAIRWQMRKEGRMELAQKREPECFVTAKLGVNNQANRNGFAIAKEWLWTAASPGTIVLLKHTIGIITERVLNRPNIFPASVCDKISSASHRGTSFVVLQPGRCHDGWVVSSSITPNEST